MMLGAFIEAIKRAQTARCHWIRAASHLADRVKAIRGDFAGNVTIEFGFIVLFMVTLAIGAFDFGRLGYSKIAVTNAARAGTQYGVQNMSTAANIPGMKQAARNDIGDTNATLDISARNYYACPGQGEVADESVLCNDGTFSYFYVEVTVPDEIDLLFPYPGIESPRQIASTNIMRVR
jgi:Flp pilus assembly protein TadG